MCDRFWQTKSKNKKNKKPNWFLFSWIISEGDRRDTWRNVRRKSWLIEDRCASCGSVQPFCSFFGTRTRRRAIRECAARIGELRRTQMAYELRGLCSRVHTHVRGCWPAAEYNSGNTMELGQSCFDARLRSFFHTCCCCCRGGERPPLLRARVTSSLLATTCEFRWYSVRWLLSRLVFTLSEQMKVRARGSRLQ